ncbi:hypothetical protein [Desulfoluna spongiiphila]|uniref:PQ loop repeat-containing protein n=1 Tax=Desulfoluna spongiiphila TaxID=419481 RepID=A0A1G5AFN7_9BACT|nr:hypothetical protein [Desulfoluna spongiiphila]SCX76708.1 hypothetical protein SAMN05216233_101145 [Desulfoluna spongiiphila]VVS90627.1 hypothetical protein DBB_1940 [Desulfoluna spongiiphila]
MSVFEIAMLVCFGFAWPASIWKSWTSRNNSGKSLQFLCIVLVGYAAGIAHKLIYSYDGVIILYGINAMMVTTDIVLWFRNGRLMKGDPAMDFSGQAPRPQAHG